MRQTLSLARYVRWADAVKAGKDQATIKRLFEDATSLDPGGRNIPQCAFGYPSMKPLVDALKSQSLFDVPHQRC